MSSPYVIALDASSTTDPAALGGKGAALSRLVRAGLPVPRCAVVTTESYRELAADPAVASMIETVQRASSESPVEASVVDAFFATVALPERVEAAIVDAAQSFGDASLAVRSSATAEDMQSASFAGQYRSSLGVTGAPAVVAAVRATWASLWHPGAIAYRRAWGVDENDVAMAVVLMRMIDARMAGVVFTVDPAGAASDVHVEAVSGLGEQLVSGAATPSAWTFPRASVATVDVPDAVRAATTLSIEIADLEHAPQDVEWAWDGHTTWSVQARPITTVVGDGFDTPPDGHELTTEGIAEMLPGVLAPLVWDVNAFLVEEAFRQTLAEVGALPHGCLDDDRRFVRRVHGRAALDFDLMRESAVALHEDAAAELERRYFGHETQPDDSPRRPRRRRRGHLGQALRTGAARRRALESARVVVDIADAFDGATPALELESDRWMLRYRRRIIDVGARAMAAELAVAAVAIAAEDQLEALLCQSLDRADASIVARDLTSAAGYIPSPPPYASRGVFGGSTWAELPEGPPNLPVRDVDERAERRRIEAELEARAEWRTSRFIGAEIIDIRAHLLRRLADDATHALRMREMTKRALLIIGGELRRVHLELARRLVDGGVLASIDDVDCLGDVELEQVVTRRSFPPGLLQQRRRSLARAATSGPLPQRFRGRPHDGAVTTPPDLAPSHEFTLHGWAASRGVHTGTARVVKDATSPSALEPGDVLVAASTDASWLPLFLRAGAIVVERGGPLSHAAIVARELGLPAVLNVEDATVALEGRLVTVDGDEGSVRVHAAPDAGLRR